MSKMTSGPGWSLSSDQTSAPSKKENSAPRPKIKTEKRAGKYVTSIAGLHTYGTERLKQIAKELKITCGSGGTVKNGVIEIQGDHSDLIKSWIEKNCGS